MPILNSINNATSMLTVDPGSSGDSYVQYSINSTSKYRQGVDDDDGDSFKISIGSSLGTSDAFIMTIDGERTLPLQPYVLATRNSTASNVTGDSTVYTVDWNNMIIDRGSDMSGTTFTAPVSGYYHCQMSVTMADLTTSHTNMAYYLFTSNRNYVGVQSNPGNKKTGGNTCNDYMSVVTDFDTGDTATFRIAASGSTLTVDVSGGGPNTTNLSISLVY